MVLSLTPNPTLDKSTSIDHVAPEIKLRCNQPTYEPGGGGVNVARVLHRLDVRTRLLYPSGGPNGALLEGLLGEDELDHTPVTIEGMTRESFMIRETSSGQQYRFSEPGPELRDSEWQSVLDHVEKFVKEGGEYVVGSGSLPPAVPEDEYATVARMARDNNVRFVLDTSGNFLRGGLQGHPFLIKPNLRELRQIVNRDLETDQVIIKAAGLLIDDGKVDNVIVSLGAGGAVLVNETLECTVRAPTVTIDSKVGAGDSMVAGLIFGLIRTDDVKEAVRYGIAAGTAAVKTPGSELARPDDVRDLVEKVTVEKRDKRPNE